MADIDTDTAVADPFIKRGPGRPPKAQQTEPAGKVTILIPKTKDAVRDVFVSVNGKPYLLKRGVPVEVDRSIAHALENARQTEYETVVDPITGRKELVPQETMSYPFQYV